MQPQARQDRVIVQEVGQELAVYDQARHRAHRLNRTAALVWRHCDGHTTVAEQAALLAREGLPADEELVWLALEQLDKAQLLSAPLEQPAGATALSRRQALNRARLAGLALMVPVVGTIIAPTPVRAFSF